MTTPSTKLPCIVLLLAFFLPACDGPEPPGADRPDEASEVHDADLRADGELAPEQEAFWGSLEEHCGQAYSGELADVTEYYREGVEGRRAVAHFFDCSPDRIHVAFHLDDDRSRNWVLTRAGGTLRLKHDHRNPDGTEEEITQYGGDAPVPGLPHRQIFWADAHTEEILPERWDNFWFLDFAEEETLHYGVHWPTEGHSIRFAFDLASPVEAPPDPWGF